MGIIIVLVICGAIFVLLLLSTYFTTRGATGWKKINEYLKLLPFLFALGKSLPLNELRETFNNIRMGVIQQSQNWQKKLKQKLGNWQGKLQELKLKLQELRRKIQNRQQEWQEQQQELQERQQEWQGLQQEWQEQQQELQEGQREWQEGMIGLLLGLEALLLGLHGKNQRKTQRESQEMLRKVQELLRKVQDTDKIISSQFMTQQEESRVQLLDMFNYPNQVERKLSYTLDNQILLLR